MTDDHDSHAVQAEAIEVISEAIRLVMVFAEIRADQEVRRREREALRAAELSRRETDAATEKLVKERIEAEPLLRAPEREGFWEEATAEEIVDSWRRAQEWSAAGDREAEAVRSHMREKVLEKFGVELPEGPERSEELARLLAEADPRSSRAEPEAEAEVAAEAEVEAEVAAEAEVGTPGESAGVDAVASGTDPRVEELLDEAAESGLEAEGEKTLERTDRADSRALGEEVEVLESHGTDPGEVDTSRTVDTAAAVREAEAFAALEGMEDQEAAEAASIAGQGYGKGPEYAVRSAPGTGSSAPSGPAAGVAMRPPTRKLPSVER